MPTPKKSFLLGCLTGIVALLALITISIALATFLLPKKELAPPNFNITQKADYNWNVTTQDGETFPMTNAQGKPLFLLFWRPTCSVCVSELPAINTLYDTFKDDITFIGISLDKDVDDADELIAKLGTHFPTYRVDEKPPAVFDIPKTPTTYLVAPDGTILLNHSGPANWQDESVLRKLRLLAEKKDDSSEEKE